MFFTSTKQTSTAPRMFIQAIDLSPVEIEVLAASRADSRPEALQGQQQR